MKLPSYQKLTVEEEIKKLQQLVDEKRSIISDITKSVLYSPLHDAVSIKQMKDKLDKLDRELRSLTKDLVTKQEEWKGVK